MLSAATIQKHKQDKLRRIAVHTSNQAKQASKPALLVPRPAAPRRAP